MNTRRILFTLGALVLSFEPAIAGSGHPEETWYAIKTEPSQVRPRSKSPNRTYLQDIVPIFMGKCYRCHNQQTTFLNNWLDYRAAYADRAELKRRIWDSWRGLYFKQPMPIVNSPEAEALSEEERIAIKEWIEGGALYGVPPKEADPHSKAERIEAGRQLFTTICAACHQPTGMGLPNRFPPLAGSDFLNADKARAIQVLLHGLQGEVTVNGLKFNNSMPQLPLSDGQIAAALTYVYNSFGNSGKDVTTEEVKGMRAQKDGATMTENRSAIQPTRPSELSPWE
jgi:mono/diheme cytochrome c family protein